MVKNRRKQVLVMVILLLGFLLANSVWGELERTDGYFTLIDGEGRIICRTAHQVKKGDQYLSEDNLMYQVEEVKEDTAHLRFVKKINLEAAASPSIISQIKNTITTLIRGEEYVQGKNRAIAIYHTHSDESYVPSDGRSSIKANGGIFQVGDTLAQTLKEKGTPIIHDKTPHDPHDAMAYDRSRRTAVNLLKQNPIALIDLHRDAVPPEEYADQVNNTAVTKAQLVIGRQNPNRKSNEAFAYQVKAVVDRKYPGLVKGIFYGDGKYNQDLAPRLLLVEMGAHTNSKEEAKRGAAIFASAAQEVLSNQAASSRTVGSGAAKSALWIMGLVIVGGIIYFLLNRGWGNVLGGITGDIKAGDGSEGDQDQDSPGEG
jgi:stage II sporulation protein P